MLERLKLELEEAAFMLVDDASRKAIHSKLISCLVLLEQLEGVTAATDSSENIVPEINKVKRRLRIWAKPERQDQYNSRILNAYLELIRSGITRVTEEQLRVATGDEAWFTPNFNQMKAISDRNHGKVFDVKGQYVDVWAPVHTAVDEYERQIFEASHG